jgi:hypothetical protein
MIADKKIRIQLGPGMTLKVSNKKTITRLAKCYDTRFVLSKRRFGKKMNNKKMIKILTKN